MLKAYLYQLSHSFFKRKANVVFTCIAIVATIGMLILTGFFTRNNGDAFNAESVCGGMSILTLLIFDLSFANVTNGMLMYSNPDVQFMFAGPFTKKFNLIIPIISSIKGAFITVFVVSMQAAYLSMLLKLRTFDAFVTIGGIFVVSLLGSILAQVINAAIHNRKKVKNLILLIFAAFHVALLSSSVIELMNIAGSFTGIKSLGYEKILSVAGNNIFLKIIPCGGWFTLIYDGIYLNSGIRMILGIILVIAVIAIIIILLNNIKFDYYEEAIAAAQKIADKIAAKTAGVEDVSAVDVSKINVSNSGFKRGSGASVFFYKHLIENKRFSKLFFFNKTMLIYKLMALIYIVILRRSMVNDSKMGIFVGALIMLTTFDTIIFAGGKTVLEYNKPYFFLIPEKISKKLWASVAGNVPEIILSSVISTGALVYAMDSMRTAPAIIGSLVFFFATDITCIFFANIIASVFNYMSKTPSTMLRQFGFFTVIGLIITPGIIVSIITKTGMSGFMITSAACMCICMIIVSSLATLAIRRKEMV